MMRILVVLAGMVVADPVLAFDPSSLVAKSEDEFRRLQEANKQVEAENRARVAERRAREAEEGRNRPVVIAEQCRSTETCYEVLEMRQSGATLRCIKGEWRGQERCISHNGKGYWADGCSITKIAAHHYKFQVAANKACGAW